MAEKDRNRPASVSILAGTRMSGRFARGRLISRGAGGADIGCRDRHRIPALAAISERQVCSLSFVAFIENKLS